jgi:hypothetical protein
MRLREQGYRSILRLREPLSGLMSNSDPGQEHSVDMQEQMNVSLI